MKFLIVTQAVDTEDQILRFFHRWIEEFAKHVERVEVICLKEGAHTLPANVRVHSLGKEKGSQPFFLYVFRFLGLIWKLRKDYDAVFVHMNPEYVVLGGVLWRSLRKKTGLWYTHKQVDLKLRLAEAFADEVFTASKESFRLASTKIHVMGHGIDTGFFTPDPSVARGKHWLSVGRLMRTKRHDLAIREAHDDGCALRIAGDGPERAALEALAQKLGAQVAFLTALSQDALRNEYRQAAKLIHRSETGSLDKVVLEALACGCPVDTSDPALKFLEKVDHAYVRSHHALDNLIPRILAVYAAGEKRYNVR